MTQRGEGACVTLPIRIIPLPIKLEPENPDGSPEESKTEIIEDDKVQLAVDQLSQTYNDKYIKGWELAWQKGEKPKVLTDKEIEQEENEIKASVANFEVEKVIEKQMKSNRLPKEIEEINLNPIQSVKLIHHDENTVKILVQGPESTPYQGGSFQFQLMFGKNYPFEAPVVECLSKIYHPQVSQQGDMKLEFLNDWVPTCTLRQLIEFISRSFI
jgi:ubiquitin-protein ligase